MNKYAEEEYVARVGGSHAALIVIGEDYDRESAPSLEAVREVLSDSEWELSAVYDMEEGPVEVQHEFPPTEPYEAWGVVIAFEQSPTVLDYYHDGPVQTAIDALNDALDGIEIWVDAV